MYSDEAEILETIASLKKEGIEFVSPTHCTGDQAITLFSQSFDDHYIRGGIGARIAI